MRALVLAVVLFGCDRGTSGDCTPASAAMTKHLGLNPAEDAGKIKSAIAKHCADDHWNPEAKRCLVDAKTSEDRLECEENHLTSAQLDKLATGLASFHKSRASAAMSAMESFKDKMCRCKSMRCAQDVSDEMTKWSQEMSKNQREPPRMSEADQRRAAHLGEEMGKCMQAAMTQASIDSIEPSVGAAGGGTKATLRGSNFIGGPVGAKVYFGTHSGVEARVTSDDEITLATPPGKDGETVDVRVVLEPSGGEVTLPKAFTFKR